MLEIGTKQIETPRLVLRRFTVEDAPAMYRNWASDAEVTKYLTWPVHASCAVSASVLTDWVKSYASGATYQWAIVPKEGVENEPIGSIGVVHAHAEIGLTHIGYCIGRAWWHKGITSEALAAVIRFLFEEAEVNKVESRHDPRNSDSGKVMEKCGLRYEGTQRAADQNNQGICDAAYYGLLRTEYFAGTL